MLVSKAAEYMLQTTLHSLVIALVVEALLRAWKIERPQIRLRFRLLVLVLPLVSFPLYYLIDPTRGSSNFGGKVALFHLKGWLELYLWDGVPFWYLIAAVMLLSTLLFLLQEAMPPLRHYLLRQDLPQGIEMGVFPKLDAALGQIGYGALSRPPGLLLVEQREPLAYAAGVRHRSLVLSPSLIEMLDLEELKGVLAHELAHILKGDNRWSWALLLVRVAMFYNPVALFAFRQIIHENEKVCDEMAISLTRRPLAFAAGLIKAFRGAAPHSSSLAHVRRGWFSSQADALANRAGKALIEDRVERILHPSLDGGIKYEGVRLGLTVAVLAVLLFFVV